MRGDSLKTLEVKPGDKLSSFRHNEVLRRLTDMQRETAPGRRAPEGAAAAQTKPFTISISGTSYTLFPGTINSLAPSNILSTFVYTPATTRFVKLRVTTNGKAVTGATIVDEATPTGAIDATENAAPTTFDVLIGVIADGTVFQVWQLQNIRALLLVAQVQSKVTPVPGTSPYIFFYTWAIQNEV